MPRKKKEVTLEKAPESRQVFTTFNGIFIPTFVSIIGVIIFLRLGFVVGSAGILPTIVIILLAASVTFTTGLSLSSITTNIRIGPGGAYSIISKTLGLEVGGGVGIPLYLAQVFGVTLYLFGFTEVWETIFPNHPAVLVAISAFLLIAAITSWSPKVASRFQIVIFGIVVAAITMALTSSNWLTNITANPLVGSFEQLSFWALFALFFPGVTGIMAGIGLSGELSDPKKQIPRGLLSAIGITTLLYVIMAIWYGYSASPKDLVSNTNIILWLARWSPLMIAGILTAAFTGALTAFSSAPRLLHAMAKKGIFPGSSAIIDENRFGVPYKAVMISAFIIILTLALGNLNSVAPIITMFFLITYATINIVVFIEQSIGLVSFRPTLNIPRIVPLYGAIAAMIIVFLIHALTGIIAVSFVFLTYLYLVKRRLSSQEGDIRSGLFITFSEWAAKKVLTLPDSSKHTWKPNILLPIVNTSTILGNFPAIKSIIYPNGTLIVLGLDITDEESSPEVTKGSTVERRSQLRELPMLVKKLSHEGIFTSSTSVAVVDYTTGVLISLEAMSGQTFPPNIIYLPFKANMLPANTLSKIFTIAKKHKTGIILSDRDSEVGLGTEEDIHVWLPSTIIEHDIFHEKNINLALLVAYRLFRNWNGTMTVRMCTTEKNHDMAIRYLKKLLYEARFPSSTKIEISIKSFEDTLKNAPKGDIHIIPVTKSIDVFEIQKISEAEEKTFMFIADSGKEDVLA